MIAIQWYAWVIAALVGLAIGWLAGAPYKKGAETKPTSGMIINLILGAVGGLLGTLLLILLRSLLLQHIIIGVLIMSAVGAILLIWLISRLKQKESSGDKTRKIENL